MCIIRPAIITNSLVEPFTGWVDSLAAAVAMFLFVGLGIVKYAKGSASNVADLIPVDTVVAGIIVATAHSTNQNNLPIYHIGSSDLNPIVFSELKLNVLKYWNSTVSASKVSKADILLSKNERRLRI